jgi:hypothetical protein
MTLEGLSVWLGLWPPLYTEQWAPTYLQILFQNLLFALGAPTAVYSLLDADIKNLTLARVQTGRFFLATAMLYLGVCGFILSLSPESALTPHAADPTQQESAAPASRSRPLEDITPAATPPNEQNAQSQPAPVRQPTLVEDADGVLAASPQRVAMPQQAPQLRSGFKSVYVAGTMVVVPLIVVVIGVWLNNNLERERIAIHIERALLKRINDGRGLESYSLRDLIYMGEHGRPGEEKDIVLNIIDSVTKRTQEKAREFNYKGYELDSLIRHLPAMLDNAAQAGNDENYLRVADLLKDIWRWLSTRTVSDDVLATKAAIRQLALRSVTAMAEDTTFHYLDVAADCDSNIVLEMGLMAIKAGKYRIVAGALDKLETMAGVAADGHGSGLTQRTVKGNLLGIVACMAAEGTSATMRAETTLRLNEELFAPSLRRAINNAFDYHYRAGRFEIADKVKRLSAEAEKMKTIDLDRDIPQAGSL